MSSEEIAKQVENLWSRKRILAAELLKIDKELSDLQKKCKHEKTQSFRQEYTGSWTNCLDCGKEDL